MSFDTVNEKNAGDRSRRGSSAVRPFLRYSSIEGVIQPFLKERAGRMAAFGTQFAASKTRSKGKRGDL